MATLESHNFSVLNDTLNGVFDSDRFSLEYQTSDIPIAIQSISVTDDDIEIITKDTLIAASVTELNSLISTHEGAPVNLDEPTDSDGSPIVQPKAAPAGWAYQYHTFSFNTGGLTSVLNENFDFTSKDFCTIKVLKDDAGSLVECTDQADADANGIVTDLTWIPNHDFRVIGATMAQKSVPTSPVIVHLRAVPQFPKPNGSVDFASGGYNLEYLGAQGQVSIDGRVAKTLKYTSALARTNEFSLRIKHSAGVSHGIQLSLQMFLPPGL